MRLFVAVFPPDRVRADLAARVAGLRVAATAERGARVRLTRPERWHLTVAFLGDVPDERRTEVEHAVGAAVRGHPPARLRLAGGGCFGRASVLWVGVGGDVAALGGLRASIAGRLATAGLPCDDRPFTPHLTVAFPAGRAAASDVAADRVALDAYRGPPWTADRIVLVHSRLGADGGYDTVRAWDLTSA